MGGRIGTAIMLAQCSDIGLSVTLSAVPRPPDADLARQMTVFPSFGFLLTCTGGNAGEIIAPFAAHDNSCSVIGHCDAGSRVDLVEAGERRTARDLSQASLIRCGIPAA